MSYALAYSNKGYHRLLVTTGVSLNLSVLGLFKYGSLFYTTLVREPGNLGEWILHIPLPVGISFYTFQGISLLVDVYTGKYFSPKTVIPKSLGEHTLKSSFFIVFFPQLVAGPIVKAHDFLYQIREKSIREIPWQRVFRDLLTGYFLKMVVADNLQQFTTQLSYPWFQGYSGTTLLVLLWAYSMQIFADFSGYSLIAIGLARLFGYELKDNFLFPYISKTFREFWTRWHISLSSFLKEYLYIPLGGNRKGKFRTYINLFITMLLGGLWHGASWNFVSWGGFHGLLLAVERLFLYKNINSGKLQSVLQRLLVFSLVSFAWLFFIFPEFAHVGFYLKSVVANFSMQDDYKLISASLIYASPVLLYHVRYLILQQQGKLGKKIRKLDFLVFGTMLFLLILNSGDSHKFIYFQF